MLAAAVMAVAGVATGGALAGLLASDGPIAASVALAVEPLVPSGGLGVASARFGRLASALPAFCGRAFDAGCAFAAATRARSCACSSARMRADACCECDDLGKLN